jgi:hypothetical protein
MTTETVNWFRFRQLPVPVLQGAGPGRPVYMPRVSACSPDAPLTAVHALGWVVSVLKDGSEIMDIQAGGSASRRWNDAYVRYGEVYGENAPPPYELGDEHAVHPFKAGMSARPSSC